MMTMQLKPNQFQSIFPFNWKDAIALEKYLLMIPQKLVTQKIMA